ncbi:MAG: DUF1932 domain-containing protein [Acidimicrobiia bacterium]
MNIGYLHPGMMGASLATESTHGGWWVAEGRSPATRQRALTAGLSDAGSLEALSGRADVIVSVCPPGEALTVAATVAATGFDGIYADLNATSPTTAREISRRFARFVDGGIIGPPVSATGTTRLYLCGSEADAVAAIWKDSFLDVHTVSGGPGAASALKVCYAGWTKVSNALLLNVRAAAAAEGVEDDLLAEWAISQPDLAARSERVAAGNAAKAWRFVGEMNQIGDTFASHGLPDGFARAAADVYGRMAPLRDADEPDVRDIVMNLLET